MKRHMLFFAQGDCPCGGQTGNAIAQCSPQGALIADTRYFSLTTAPAGQMLVVPKGSNAQAFLRAANDFRGFIFYSGEEVRATNAPQLTLPLLNPAVSNAYPVPGGVKYIVAGVGDPTDWRHFAAPTAGTYTLQSKNGAWVLVDSSTLPGLDAIGSSSLTTLKGGLMMIIAVDEDTYAIRRLAVADKRVVVGDVDQDTGAAGFKTLPPGSPLEHPLAKFTALTFRTVKTLDQNGAEIAGGLEQAVVSGAGAVTDAVRIIYSPTTSRIMRAPAQTIKFSQVTVASASVVAPATYAAMPSGHGAGLNLNYNYATVRIDFQISFSAVENLVFGIFRDGTLLQEFPNTATLNLSISYVDESNPLGGHTYDVRWKKTSGSTASIITQSSLLITTLG